MQIYNDYAVWGFAHTRGPGGGQVRAVVGPQERVSARLCAARCSTRWHAPLDPATGQVLSWSGFRTCHCSKICLHDDLKIHSFLDRSANHRKYLQQV